MYPRRQFLLSGGGLVVGAALGPVARGAAAVPAAPPKPPTRPKLLRPEEGDTVWVVAGVRITVKLRSEDTNGAYAVFQDFVLPGAGPGLHVHTREDESLFVLEGEVRATLGDRTFDVRPGTLVHMPLGVPHGFKNVSAGPARLLMTYTPGGFESCFLEAGKPARPDDVSPPSFTAEEQERALAVMKRRGVFPVKG
jgi:mannose-6-phosphate isomerase-like protein (cupin superfamily)